MKRETFNLDAMGRSLILDAYIEDGTENRDAVLIFPGGGYENLSVEREGAAIANAYLTRGLNAFVLQYSVGTDYTYPCHLIDASVAFVFVKSHAAEFGIDPRRIFTVGFSAGGHLSGSMAVLHKDPKVLSALGIEKGDNKPCGSVLAYPVVSANVPTHEGSFVRLAGKPFSEITPEERNRLSLEVGVDEDSAPAFIWHTSADNGVPMIGSLRLAEAYYNRGMTVSLHVYPYGTHGIALANEETACGNPDWIQPLASYWVDESVRWMKTVKSY